jgi:hypothetical protein
MKRNSSGPSARPSKTAGSSGRNAPEVPRMGARDPSNEGPDSQRHAEAIEASADELQAAAEGVTKSTAAEDDDDIPVFDRADRLPKI